MFFIDPTADQGIQPSDGLILEQAFLLELEEILPMPASADFLLHDPAFPAAYTFGPEQQELIQTWQAELDFSSDRENFYYRYTRRLLENGELLREKRWEETIPRDFQ